MGAATLITMTNNSMPKVSYVKAVDYYLVICYVMVFAALIEFAFVTYASKRLVPRLLPSLPSSAIWTWQLAGPEAGGPGGALGAVPWAGAGAGSPGRGGLSGRVADVGSLPGGLPGGRALDGALHMPPRPLPRSYSPSFYSRRGETVA